MNFILAISFFIGLTFARGEEIRPITKSPVHIDCIEKGSPVCAVMIDSTGDPPASLNFKLFETDCARQRHIWNTGQEYVAIAMHYCATNYCPLRCNTIKFANHPWVRGPVCVSNGTEFKRFPWVCDYLNFVCNEPDGVWSEIRIRAGEKCA